MIMKRGIKLLSSVLMALCLAAALSAVLPAGGLIKAEAAAGDTYTVKVDSGYLALRTAKAFDYNNEIGKLYTGEVVQAVDVSDSQYWWVYAPGLGKYGYVNRDYLVGSGNSSYIPAR